MPKTYNVQGITFTFTDIYQLTLRLDTNVTANVTLSYFLFTGILYRLYERAGRPNSSSCVPEGSTCWLEPGAAVGASAASSR